MLIHADCLNALRHLPDNSVDSVVTDPPYGLGFMGKAWDTFDKSQFGIAGNEGENDLKVKKKFNVLPRYKSDGLQDFVFAWASECLRVLKPGGYLLSFAGTRTQHRIACGIEDAGFEIRDMIAWVYGSGFPKSLNVGKAIDKMNGETGRLLKFTQWMRTTGMRPAEATTILRNTGAISPNGTMARHFFANDIAGQPAIPTPELWAKIRPHIAVDIPEWVDELVERIGAEREIVGVQKKAMSGWSMDGKTIFKDRDITAPATPEAKEWDGYGTALKPALEPITVARKPIEGTVAENVLNWGTGAINIDGCRVDIDFNNDPDLRNSQATNTTIPIVGSDNGKHLGMHDRHNAQGRFPANLIHDGSDEVVELFPDSKSTGGDGYRNSVFCGGKKTGGHGLGDSGSAARFFYCAKASKAERGENNIHPTVKPIALMRYLIKLVTPPNGTVLDPFLGSGTTAIAAVLEGREWIGIEREAEYCDIARARIAAAESQQLEMAL